MLSVIIHCLSMISQKNSPVPSFEPDLLHATALHKPTFNVPLAQCFASIFAFRVHSHDSDDISNPADRVKRISRFLLNSRFLAPVANFASLYKLQQYIEQIRPNGARMVIRVHKKGKLDSRRVGDQMAAERRERGISNNQVRSLLCLPCPIDSDDIWQAPGCEIVQFGGVCFQGRRGPHERERSVENVICVDGADLGQICLFHWTVCRHFCCVIIRLEVLDAAFFLGPRSSRDEGSGIIRGSVLSAPLTMIRGAGHD